MSGEAGGLALLPLAVFALPVLGVVLVGGAAIAGIGAAASAAARYEDQQRQRREEIRRSGLNESIGSFRSNVAANMNEQQRLNVKASEEMMKEMWRTQQNLISLSENYDPEKYQQYMGQIRSSRQELSNTMIRIQDGFVKNYHAKIHESMDNITRTINGQYATYVSELQSLNSNIQAKQERARQIANDYIEEAKTLLDSLDQDYEGVKFSGAHLTELHGQLEQAVRQYNMQNYEAALSTAKDVSISTLEEIYKADCKKQEWDNYYKIALALASELEAYLEAQSVITEETKQKVEAQLGRELEEDVVGVKITDYTDKMKDGRNQYEYLTTTVKGIKSILESDEAKKLTTSQLKEYFEILNSKIFPAATTSIYKAILNMNNAFSRQNISEEIIDFFEEHNFSFKGYSYDEDKHDGALHIGLENEATGEEIIVTLAPELMQNGEVQTRIEIDQLMGDEANEERKAFYRESVENVVVNNTPGAQIKLECNKEYKNKLSNKTELRNRLKA